MIQAKYLRQTALALAILITASATAKAEDWIVTLGATSEFSEDNPGNVAHAHWDKSTKILTEHSTATGAANTQWKIDPTVTATGSSSISGDDKLGIEFKLGASPKVVTDVYTKGADATVTAECSCSKVVAIVGARY
ncbi:MAG: hypothetical protein JWQ02_1331, partial [Capsulimonas sp.]|nr:hypothetical protein [Capsulimonas sp.]